MAGSDYSVLTPVKFSIEELKEIKEQAKELYVYVNAMYDEHDLEGLENHIDALHDIGINGLIFQDFGVLRMVNQKGYDDLSSFNS